MSILRNHPFAVEAFFESSLVFTFAISKEHLQDLIPHCLELDTFNDHWAFVAIAMVQTKDLRPKGFPKQLGNDFFLIGYRIFVRFTNKAGKKLRGLYILKSETNSKKMEVLGNLFTNYQYTTTDISRVHKNDTLEISSAKSGFHVVIETKSKENIEMPDATPFYDWKEARRYAGPLPFTFSFNPMTNKVLIIEGVRKHWKPEPVRVIDYSFSFPEKLDSKDFRLACAFIVKNIPYTWKKGKVESLSV
ncbi:DUF2071 domain-containing protein [Flavitalea sp.]|nr:DUF2071 domain-containing protein [Flavitalea sp.]